MKYRQPTWYHILQLNWQCLPEKQSVLSSSTSMCGGFWVPSFPMLECFLTSSCVVSVQAAATVSCCELVGTVFPSYCFITLHMCVLEAPEFSMLPLLLFAHKDFVVRLYGMAFMVRFHFWNVAYSDFRKTKMVLT